MKWLFGVVVALASLTACAPAATLEESSAFEELADGGCTSEEKQLVQKHISGQIAALSKEDWKRAYSFAAQDSKRQLDLISLFLLLLPNIKCLSATRVWSTGPATSPKKELLKKSVLQAKMKVINSFIHSQL